MIEAAEPRSTLVLLMVSGGSDSTALLELAAAYAAGENDNTELLEPFQRLYSADVACLHVLHVNHMLRGAQADEDEAFVVRRCAELGIPCEVARLDIRAIAQQGKGGIEATAREQRYLAAESLVDRLCAEQKLDPSKALILTAHTLDDRIETFYMRSLVGTGPGGFGSIPRERGRLRRPLLDATREQLRDYLRGLKPGVQDSLLWRDDPTNDDGSNFRSQVRTQLLPVLRDLRPGFERVLAQTMDLIAEEDDASASEAESVVYRNLVWDGETAQLSISALSQVSRPMARRILRASLLVVNPDARLEAAQIERVLENLGTEGFVTETSGGIRVRVNAENVSMHKAQ